MFSMTAPPLLAEPAAVLDILTDDAHADGLRVNDLCARTGLPTAHVGRHLRTLERERLARYAGACWHATPRALRLLADEAAGDHVTAA